ncbi:MAG: peptidoglycan DD-metalloendopeptidase family protein [Bacteroidaceae bacterium]|jgi:septal ring factor EnvC (AmiA/AmiB activator)|nr:peptidoglycan DD-metalloendopeptidase family protein [Bacteroidaceae bacterium]MBQ2299891.1 peptidoglycan DD-metalloendopeptidase family protein [Bacteroidaceae bacterium]MBQ5622208.1 peptidoglycan DD-metalloendopeptidase family protein [Bacteroidaceae bacterium]MBQ5680657.1 peptidoglycan DD-metalloendopeptidase family protein [Bacteroidaceae bacterium]MBQ5713337.1 peptidoglycan DD-metalloendopeptidase family protein [Bacteroidaceae bacterium]
MNRILFLCLSLMLFLPLAAQNSKKVKELKQQQSKLKTELQNSKTQLSKTQKRVKSGQQNVDYLGALVNNRLKRIHELEEELNKLEDDITRMQKDITRIDSELRLRRQRLKAAIRNARVQRENHDPLVFIFSAKTVSQMYRRARYAREYVVYQHNLSGQVLQKQAELLKAQNRLLEAKSRKSAKLNEIMEQRKSLNEQQMQEKERVAGLKKKESGLKGKVAEQQKQIAALDRKIEEVIAYEIEQARKKAEEEARKKKAAAKKTTTTKTKQPASTSKPKTETKPATTQKSGSWLTAADRQLNGTFEQNKGRLPVPITGQYMLGNRFGIYNVPGMKNVQLDNKGTDYVGRPGARARAIFDGVVTSVFQFSGTRNVLVRHGSYISVYCNLSSTIVQKGQKVRARDILGTVANDGSGNCTLHFQLRKETTKLNPEAWIGR